MSSVAYMTDDRSEPPREPNSVEAEAALLGAIMIDNRVLGWPNVGDLTADAFYEPVHGRIFSQAAKIVNDGGTANPVTLKPFFEADEALKTLGGIGYLAQLSGSGAGLIGASDFARQISDIYKRRELLSALRAAVESCIVPVDTLDVTSILESLDQAVVKVSVDDRQRKVTSLAGAWDAGMERYDEIAEGKITPGLRLDGLEDVNELLGGGLRGGNLIILAGRPGMGKTALAVSLASSAARAGIVTNFNSMEMSIEELIERQVCDICFEYGHSFTYEQLKRGQVPPHQRVQINAARERIAEWPLYFDDTADIKVGHLIGKIRRLKQRLKARGQTLQLVIVDYLQLIRPDRESNSKVNDISDISRALKVAAKDLDITIVALSQLSRAVEQRDDKRPQLSDLRESGAIEQDADAVLFVYREQYYLEAAEPPKGPDSKALEKWEKWELSVEQARDRMDLIARKVRGGKTGARKMYFFGAYQAVRDGHYLARGAY